MSVVDFFISKLAPYDCLGCDGEGRLVCQSCSSERLKPILSRCYRCRRLSPGFATCQACRSSSKLRSVRTGVVYEGLAKDLVWHLKFKGAQAAANELATYMVPLAEGIIVPVPTASSRARRRGYDQAKLLARQVARHNRLAYLDCLKRNGQSHQVGASRQQRLKQLSSAFWVSPSAVVSNQNIILVDDVVTTGATLEAAAAILKNAGARTVSAVVFAQP